MPPAISDDELESDGPDMIPAKGKIPAKETEEVVDEEEEDDEDDPDEYRVEKILKHDFTEDGQVIYQIKWLGYEKKSDLTWEPIDNLGNATEVLEAYHERIGGEPVFETGSSSKKKAGKPGKRSASAAFDSPAVEPTAKKRGRKSAGDANGFAATPSKKALPEGSWENHIARVTSLVQEDAAPKGKMKGNKRLIGLLEWNDGSKTQHTIECLRTKCPSKLLDYYEQHLVFKSGDADEEEYTPLAKEEPV